MSIHPSLRVGGKGKKHKSVLKRHERLKTLKEKGLWDETKSVFGIPKVKMVKVRVKKEKAAAPDAVKAAGVPSEGAASKPAQETGPSSKADKK